VSIAGAGCGEDGTSARAPTTDSTTQPAGSAAEPAHLEGARCGPAASGCESASGPIIYVERVDPDGDGDAHFVLAGGDSITAPGISVIDVRADLRPDPLPGPGDRVSAAGPVQTGSYGQRQIHAEILHVARSR
jgi:hypothetical protein